MVVVVVLMTECVLLHRQKIVSHLIHLVQRQMLVIEFDNAHLTSFVDQELLTIPNVSDVETTPQLCVAANCSEPLHIPMVPVVARNGSTVHSS